MTLYVDLYYTLRSPYCYLSTPQLRDLVATYDLEFRLKPVYPLAVSDPTFFTRWKSQRTSRRVRSARSIATVMERVCEAEGIRREKLTGAGRRAGVSCARAGVAHLWLERLDQSGPVTARALPRSTKWRDADGTTRRIGRAYSENA